jgi:hypothetical protein
MSAPKKCTANDHLFASRNKVRNSRRRAARVDQANRLQIASPTPRTNGLTFLEDFVLEHSLRGLRITSVEMGSNF